MQSTSKRFFLSFSFTWHEGKKPTNCALRTHARGRNSVASKFSVSKTAKLLHRVVQTLNRLVEKERPNAAWISKKKLGPVWFYFQHRPNSPTFGPWNGRLATLERKTRLFLQSGEFLIKSSLHRFVSLAGPGIKKIGQQSFQRTPFLPPFPHHFWHRTNESCWKAKKHTGRHESFVFSPSLVQPLDRHFKPDNWHQTRTSGAPCTARAVQKCSPLDVQRGQKVSSS